MKKINWKKIDIILTRILAIISIIFLLLYAWAWWTI